MARAVIATVTVAAVFLLGFWAGRVSLERSSGDDGGVDPSAEAVQPGSAADPISMGTPADVGGWTLEVAGFDPDATEAVLSSNQFNLPPAEERTYVTVEVVLTRRAPGPGVLRGSIDPALVTPAGAQYRLGSGCGVISMPVDAGRLLAQDESLRGRWCWDLPVVELDKVRLRVAGTGGGAVWFSLG